MLSNFTYSIAGNIMAREESHTIRTSGKKSFSSPEVSNFETFFAGFNP